jgi:hypothetical protein
MPICDIVEEVALLGEELTEDNVSTCTEDLLGTDELLNFWLFEPTDEVAVLNDEITESLSSGIDDAAALNDEITQLVTARTDVNDSALIGDTAGSYFSETIDETAVLDDLPYPLLISGLVEEEAVLGDEATYVYRQTDVVDESALAYDAALSFVIDTIDDVAVLDDVITELFTTSNSVDDAAVLDDEITNLNQATNTVDEVALLGEEVTYVNQLGNIVEDVFYVWGTPVLASTKAWVANVRTFAHSRYDGYAFDSLSLIDGVTLATGGGVYKSGTDVVYASIKLGKEDYKSAELKRMSDLYLSQATSEPLEVAVTTNYRGAEREDVYQADNRVNESVSTNRVRVGKGLNSRYWQFEVRNPSGGEFELYNVRADVAVSPRRV